ncbi:hypothetical protein [Aureispira anguillae]|uniref:Uncharacterized protein n=1 Tax=Aureispira anguillae TaxID=2864201 RepID=A0A915YE60_9BACT|nr:hypothetical protein [Aureispira anguillae]BDS11404.1 hypothetical protein AsAng_0021180 [Aureispira anguillae]
MKKQLLYSVFITLFLGLMANGLWLYEIKVIIGWSGLKWLNYEHKSIFIINALVNLAYCIPLWNNELVRKEKKSKLLALFALYCCTLLAYYSTKLVLFYWMFPFLSITVSTPFLIYLFSSKLIHPIKKTAIIFLTMGILFAIFMSSFTLDYIPGYGGTSGFVDATKMGYPYFWITIMMGGIGNITAQSLLIDPSNVSRMNTDDILDA